MDQSFEYYTVEPTTLADVKKIDDIITGSSFDRDSDVQTLGSATIDATKSIGESYIRCYLKTIQDEITEKFPLGTFYARHRKPLSTVSLKMYRLTVIQH